MRGRPFPVPRERRPFEEGSELNDLRIGVVGTGAIGRKHIKRISESLKGGNVVAVSDVAADGARQVAEEYGARFVADGYELIAADDVDAVIVSSWDPTHKDYVMACLEQGKYVFCEKPLATDSAGCREIVDAEMALGKRLVQVGFMRRYDRGYRQLKEVIDSGEIGTPLIMHCAHRNANMGPQYEDDYMITQVAIHEIDIVQWLLSDTYDRVRVLLPRSAGATNGVYHDPQIVLIETANGVCIDVELFMNCQFGYDIRCQAVGEKGIASLSDPSYPEISRDFQRGSKVADGWEARFTDAYAVELQEWIDSVRSDRAAGPNSWDGYAASVTADALLRSRDIQDYCSVDLPERPDFYRDSSVR